MHHALGSKRRVLNRTVVSSTLRFEVEPLDLKLVARTCDFAILNGGHGTTASLLLAGKPLLEIPLHLEQSLNAAAVTRLGAGLCADLNRPEQILTQFVALLQGEAYATAAQQFASRYAMYDSAAQIERVVRRIESLL
jgi:UDP:flavonoid glycosyltransferase YjiC (YdhE family)